mmetsp:Transcript_11392/g.13055  ORF Transcript_11392/g.13055 Transcript_11392/m.13055 type:complete len:572 (-) Transcript_11392:253-1968(-)|eukprot:CAMPEP_0184019506 /NCGR_PEP_ID=MMETSP0954-20121128/8791_1 /TAXON_ID=627963 /ORGANISM="Aplanochytrium sp, Strain PBS07" /LENGTH=571 /DNA_ID=CAMNT_0026301183 /DNA_START=316 /DNA_END=2031 /DNA_ORIENTATION=+
MEGHYISETQGTGLGNGIQTSAEGTSNDLMMRTNAGPRTRSQSIDSCFRHSGSVNLDGRSAWGTESHFEATHHRPHDSCTDQNLHTSPLLKTGQDVPEDLPDEPEPEVELALPFSEQLTGEKLLNYKSCPNTSKEVTLPVGSPEKDTLDHQYFKSESLSTKKGKKKSDVICFICMGPFTRRYPAIPTPCTNVCSNTPVHAKCIFEWSERQKSLPSCPLCRGALGKVSYTPPDVLRSYLFVMFGFRKAFITLPVAPKVGIVRCYLRAESISRRGVLGKGPKVWKLYLQAPAKLRYPLGPKPGIDSPAPGDQLLLVARKRPLLHGSNIGSTIDMTLDAKGKDFNRRGVNYVGSVRSSALGLEHTIVAPVQEATMPRKGNRVSCVGIGHVKYTQNRVGRAVGPRRMQLVLPTVGRPGINVNKDLCYHDVVDSIDVLEDEDEDGDELSDDECYDQNLPKWTTKAWRPGRSKKIKRSLRRGRRRNSDVIFASNREPYWLEQINAYSLDFQGRVTLPSNKNFQLVSRERPNEVVLQFGKVVETPKTEIYTLDLQWPVSPLQALGICLSACDRKLACA